MGPRGFPRRGARAPPVPASPSSRPGSSSRARLIRLIPAEVRAIAYFTNLILMAAFFALGLGCILSRQKPRSSGAAPVGLALVLGFVLVGRGIVVHAEGARGALLAALHRSAGRARKLPLFPRLGAFALASLPSSPRSALAREMDHHPRSPAYGWTSPAASRACSSSAPARCCACRPGSGRPCRGGGGGGSSPGACCPARRCWRRARATCCSRSRRSIVLEPYYYVQTRPQHGL